MGSKVMKALRKTQARPGAEIVELPVPSAGPGEVLIKVDVAAICGSDTHVYNWRKAVADANPKLPFTMGHEFSGEVVAAGEEVRSLKPGDRVSGETHYPCGQCVVCLTGERHICPNTRTVGRNIDGCFAEYLVLPEICAHKVPESLSPRHAALLEPLGVAVHAVTEAELSGKSAVILGVGPIGLMAVAVAKALGAMKVFATARTPAKLEKALALGATAVFNPKTQDIVKEVQAATNGNGAEVIIDFTGDPDAIYQGMQMLRPGGRVVLAAQFKGPLAQGISWFIIRKEPEIHGIWGRRMFETWFLAEELLTSGKVDAEKIIGDTYPLTSFEAGFSEAINSNIGKVLLKP